MLKRFSRFLCCMLALTLLFSASSAFAAVTGYVAANTMKVYQYPNKLSRELGTMSYGEDVSVLAIEDGWMKLKNHKGEIGYCEYGSLSRANPNNLSMYGYVKEAGAYVYAKPGSTYKVIAAVHMGDRLNVIGMTPDKQWLRVQNGSRYGYVQTDLMSKTPTWYGFTA